MRQIIRRLEVGNINGALSTPGYLVTLGAGDTARTHGKMTQGEMGIVVVPGSARRFRLAPGGIASK